MKLRRLIASAVKFTPFPEMLVRHRAAKSVTIMTYHRILPSREDAAPYDLNLFSATPEEFAREVKYLKRNLDPISMRDLAAGLSDPRALPQRPALISFDDGYWDNYQIAFPILRELGVSACFFLSTGLVGSTLVPWWDQVACCLRHSRAKRVLSPFDEDDLPYATSARERDNSIDRFLARIKRTEWSKQPQILDYVREKTRVDPVEMLDRPLFMTWEDAREMAAAGMGIGGHTRSHPVVSQVKDPARVREEISGCYQDIKQALKIEPHAFSYPDGAKEMMSKLADYEVRHAGFTLSFSFMRTLANLETPRDLPLPRLAVEHGDNFHAFRMGMATAPLPSE